MAVTSLDILNLSHSLKDICEVNCNTSECLSQTLKFLLQYNLIQANLQFGRQLAQAQDQAPCSPCRESPSSTADSCLSRTKSSPGASDSPSPQRESASAAPADCPPPIRLDIGDPFLADYEK